MMITMKMIFLLVFFTSHSFCQSLSLEEQKKLQEENRLLKEELNRLRTQCQGPADSKEIMKVLKRGQKFQEEQLKALEELDKEI